MNVRDAVDDTKLHDASLTNNAELVALLLEAGAEILRKIAAFAFHAGYY